MYINNLVIFKLKIKGKGKFSEDSNQVIPRIKYHNSNNTYVYSRWIVYQIIIKTMNQYRGEASNTYSSEKLKFLKSCKIWIYEFLKCFWLSKNYHTGGGGHLDDIRVWCHNSHSYFLHIICISSPYVYDSSNIIIEIMVLPPQTHNILVGA